MNRTTSRERPNNQVSVFPYPGGKGREADWILSRMPDHRCYVEVFGGSGALLYNKPESTVEVYNDINDDLVQFFRTLRERREELVEWLRQPDGGFRGVALRNQSGFPGRQLIAVDSDGEITDKVRVYDEDAPLLAGMLDKNQWQKRE